MDDLRRRRPRHALAPRVVAEPHFEFAQPGRVLRHREEDFILVRAVGVLDDLVVRVREGVPAVVRVAVLVFCHPSFSGGGLRLLLRRTGALGSASSLCSVSSPRLLGTSSRAAELVECCSYGDPNMQ